LGGPQILELQNNLATLLLQEDSYWRQHSKVFWLKECDTNSKFFHTAASTCHLKNTITKLRHPNGSWLTFHDETSSRIRDYFSLIFQSVQGQHQPVISRIQPHVTTNDNMLHIQPFSKEEFKEAIFSMHPDKSPSPNDFNPGFYQHIWDDLEDELSASTSSWLDTSAFPS